MTDNTACFSRQERLLKAEEFSRVFKKPFRSSDRYFTILAVDIEIDDIGDVDAEQVKTGLIKLGLIKSGPRLGLAISKKNAKRAVDRNRIKRLIRESFRQNQHQLPLIDLVVMAKPITKSAENRQIFNSLEQHWNKLVRNFQK